MGAIFCCFRVRDGHENHTSNNTCSHKNVAPRQETVSAPSIQGGASSNPEVVENISSSESRLGNGEHSDDERSILLPPQQVNVAPRQETMSTSSNIQDGGLDSVELSEDERSVLLLPQHTNVAPRQETISTSSNNQDDASSRLDRVGHSEDERSVLLLPQRTNVAPKHETVSTSSNNQDDTSSNSEVVDSNSSRLNSGENTEEERTRLLLQRHTDLAPRQATTSTSSTDNASSSSEAVGNCSSNRSRPGSSEHSEDESSILLVSLQAEIRKRLDKGSGSKAEQEPALQVLDQINSEFVPKDNTFTPSRSSSVKRVSHEVESGFVYKFPLPYDDYEEDVCPTCLEEYDDENPKIIAKCKHHFHLSCIYEWMERSVTCPVCREVMLFDE